MWFFLFKHGKRCFMSVFLLVGVLMLVLASGGQAVGVALQSSQSLRFSVALMISRLVRIMLFGLRSLIPMRILAVCAPCKLVGMLQSLTD